MFFEKLLEGPPSGNNDIGGLPAAPPLTAIPFVYLQNVADEPVFFFSAPSCSAAVPGWEMMLWMNGLWIWNGKPLPQQCSSGEKFKANACFQCASGSCPSFAAIHFAGVNYEISKKNRKNIEDY